MIKAIIFDMDGVLIDTVEAGFRVRRKLLARYGIDLEAIPDPQPSLITEVEYRDFSRYLSLSGTPRFRRTVPNVW